MTTFEFVGNMTAEVFSLLKEKTQTRGLADGWNQFMAGFSNTIKTPCPKCQKINCWAHGIEQIDPVVELNMAKSEQPHVK
jgi:hypothetical protein